MNNSSIIAARPPRAGETTTTTTEDGAPTTTAVLERKRGPAFTSAEDLMVARAFIAASENPICGAHQKGKVFKLHMFEIYKEIVDEQNSTNRALLEQASSHATRDEYVKRGIGIALSYRSSDSIFNRFKTQISPEVMKYIGITETTDMASAGWNMDDHRVACLETYKQRYGSTFDFFSCYEYLKDKNKFSAFRTKCDAESLGNRPVGKKKARQAEADSKLVKAIISEVVVKKERNAGGGASNSVASSFHDVDDTSPDGESGRGSGRGVVMNDVLQNISSVIANVGTALLENMKSEQDMRLVQSLDTPDRKMYAKEQLALRMAETREKRRRIEFNNDGRRQQEEKGEQDEELEK